MQTLILTLHIIVCVLLVILILLQAGKEGMGVIFGGGNTSVFGSSGAGGILVKLTTLMAVIFVITSLSYTFVTSPRSGGVESTILNVTIEEPVAPPAPPAPPASDAAKPEQTQGAIVAPPADQPATPPTAPSATAPVAPSPQPPAAPDNTEKQGAGQKKRPSAQ